MVAPQKNRGPDQNEGQQRKSQSVVSPVRIETFYNENKDQFYQEDKVHLRMIQLTRSDGDTGADKSS